MPTKTPKSSRSPRPRKIRVADRIVADFVGRKLPAIVVEDRGFIGFGGRQLLRIRARLDSNDPESKVVFEFPAERMRLAD